MGKNPVPSPRPCGSLLPEVTARCPPNRVAPELGPAAFSPWISSLGKRLAGAAGFVHPWLGVCSGLGGPQNVLRRPCPPVTPRGQLPWGKQSLAHTLRLNLTPPPTFPGCSCAKKQSNQTKKAQGGPRGCPQPPPPTDPKVSAEQFVPSLSVLAHPAPPHPGTRRNKNFILPFPIPTPKTPRSGGEPPPPGPWQGPIGVAVRAFPPTPVPGPSSASPGSFPPPRRCRPSEGAELGCRGALRSRRSRSCCGCCSWGCGWGCGSGWGGCESGCGSGWSWSCRSCGCGSGCTSRCSASWRTRGWAGSKGWDACERCKWKKRSRVRPPRRGRASTQGSSERLWGCGHPASPPLPSVRPFPRPQPPRPRGVSPGLGSVEGRK